VRARTARPKMKRTLVSLVILAGWGLCAGAAVAAGEGGEIFQLIESQQFDLAEKKAREELQTATGEDRNAYLFILGFIQAKQGKSEDVRRVVSAIDPASEWAPDGQFLLMIYAPARGAPEAGDPPGMARGRAGSADGKLEAAQGGTPPNSRLRIPIGATLHGGFADGPVLFGVRR